MRLAQQLLLGLITAATALPPIVISGATGRVGSAVVRALISKRGSADDIFVLARDATKVKALNTEATCLCADYEDVEALDVAFSSMSPGFHLFVACNNHPTQATLESNVCRAAKRAGCAYAVKLSTATAVLEMQQGGPYAAHLQVEQELRDLRLPHAVLRPNRIHSGAL